MSVPLWLCRVTCFAVSGWMFRSASQDAAVTRQSWIRRGRTFAFSHASWKCRRMFEASNGVPRGVGNTRSLRILANRGELELRWGPATGYWSYDGTVSYWALAPARSDILFSWASFADAQEISAEDLGLR